MEELKEAFLGKYFLRLRREVKVNEFIHLCQGDMSVEDFSLKFTLLSRYASSIVSNPGDERYTFVTGVVELVNEEYRTTMHHNDMNNSMLMVYQQSIEEFKLIRI